MKVTALELNSFLKESGVKEITIRIDRPVDFKTDPRKPEIVMHGVGRTKVHGGNHRYLVVNLTQELLSSIDPNTVIDSLDLDLAAIRQHREKLNGLSASPQ